MAMYVYRGKFSPTLKAHIFEHADNFENIMRSSIEAFGGKLDKCYLTAAVTDPIGFVEFADDLKARAWNAFYATQHGVESSHINRLLDSNNIKKICAQLSRCTPKATKHRGT